MATSERARKNEVIILQELGRVGLEAVACAIERDQSTVSKMKSAEIPKFCEFLAVCGLKVVPETYRCARPEVIEAYETLARAALNHRTQQSLVWDE